MANMAQPLTPMRQGRFIALLLAVLAMALIALAVPFGPAFAQDFPKLTGPVVDQADILTPAQEAVLDGKIRGLKATTQRQMTIATVNSLDGYEVSDYAFRLGEHWALGDKARDDGLLLLIAPNDKKMWIATGRGTEVYVTDAFSGRIVRDTLRPAFQSGDFFGGIDKATDQLIAQMQLSPEEAAAVAEQVAEQEVSQSSGIDMGTVMFWLIIFFFFILPLIRSFARAGRKHKSKRKKPWDKDDDDDDRGGGWGSPIIIWGGGGFGGGGGSSWDSGGGGWSGGGGSFGGGGAGGEW